MPICFWRHGQPNYESDPSDPVLSEVGREQSSRSADEILIRAKTAGAQSFQLISSPLKRCLETIAALAKRLNSKAEIQEHLRLRDHWESGDEFQQRLSRPLDLYRGVESQKLLVICTHADVLDFYLAKFQGPPTEIGKANFFWVSDGGRVNEVNPLRFR